MRASDVEGFGVAAMFLKYSEMDSTALLAGLMRYSTEATLPRLRNAPLPSLGREICSAIFSCLRSYSSVLLQQPHHISYRVAPEKRANETRLFRTRRALTLSRRGKLQNNNM